MTPRQRSWCHCAGVTLIGASAVCIGLLASVPTWQAAAGFLGCAAAGIPLVIAGNRDDGIDALIEATRENGIPDHVPAEWTKEYGR